MHKPALIILAVSILLFSGCVSQSSGGIIIDDFSADFQEVYSKEPIEMRIKVRNTGSLDSGPGRIILTGIEEDVIDFSSNIVEGGSCSWGRLLAPDPNAGTAGETATCIAGFIAPEIQKGMSFTIHPKARVFYEYSSSTLTSVTILTQDEMKRIASSGSAIPSQTVAASSSPVSISVQTKTPVRYWEGKQSITFPVEITVSNVGGGTVCNDYGIDVCNDPDRYNEIEIFIKSEEINFPDCSFPLKLDIWNGQATVVCDADVVSLQSQNVQKTIEAFAIYGYVIDSQPIDIRVVGS